MCLAIGENIPGCLTSAIGDVREHPYGANLKHSSDIFRLICNDFGTSQIVGRVAVTDLLFGRFSELIWAKKQNILSKTDVHRWL